MNCYAKGLILFFACVILFLCGCETHEDETQAMTSVSKIAQNGTGGDKMKNSVDMLQNKLKISEVRAEGALEILTQSGVVSPFKKVKPLDTKRGIQALVTDQTGQNYYLGFDDLGFLELVRKDSAQGEVVYGILQ